MNYIVTVNGHRIEVTLDGETVRIGDRVVSARVCRVQGTAEWVALIGDDVHRVVMRAGQARGRYDLSMNGFRYDVEALDERTRAIRDMSAASAIAAGPAPLLAPMPGLVVRINVAPGDVVAAGQGLVVMEAMKMENELRAQSAGTVAAVRVAPGTAVERGTVLIELS